MTSKLKRVYVYHILSAGFLLFSAALAIFRFSAVWIRMGQALEDLGRSIAYYFCGLFGIDVDVRVTITEIPPDAIAILPFDIEELKAKLREYFFTLFDKYNLYLFGWKVSDVVYYGSMVLLFVAPILGLLLIAAKGFYSQTCNNYGNDSKPLEICKKIEAKTWNVVQYYVKDFVSWYKKRKAYWIIAIVVWVFNFNFYTIAVELIAYYFYFAFSLDFVNLYLLFAKVVMDFSVVVDFLPWWAWALIFFKVFDLIRRRLGYIKLRRGEKKNVDFLEAHPGALFVTGKQRSKKTTIITDMALSQEVIFRERAKEKLSERDKQFPYFPWIFVENCVKEGLEKHTLFTLALCREFVKDIRKKFEKRAELDEAMRTKVLAKYKKRYGYDCKDFIFGYDFERYGLEYNDGLVIVNIFDAIERYMQLYWIYVAPSSLCISNYGIRTDLKWEDVGNFPKFNADFFKRDAGEAMAISKISHILNWNYMRLGTVDDPNDPNIDGLEIGCVNAMEIAKERGNQNTNYGQSYKDDEPNTRNDLFEMDVKMRGHAATVDNYTFFRLLFDDQRPGSLGADNKDLCDIIRIKKVSDAKIVMPGFAIEEALYLIATKIFDKLYYDVRYSRGDNTLFVYLLKKAYVPIFNHYQRVFNQYSVYTATVKVWDGMDEEVIDGKGKYIISTKKVYSNRFATDAIRDYYHQKALRAKGGLNDFECFEKVDPKLAEYDKSGSLFFRKMRKITGKRDIK